MADCHPPDNYQWKMLKDCKGSVYLFVRDSGVDLHFSAVPGPEEVCLIIWVFVLII